MGWRIAQYTYICFAPILIAACNFQALISSKMATIESGTAANDPLLEYKKEKYLCESKGGYYSKTLGCFE